MAFLILLQKKKIPANARKMARVPPEISTDTTTGSISGDGVVVFGRGEVTVDDEEGVVVVSVVTVVNVVVTFLGAGVVLG